MQCTLCSPVSTWSSSRSVAVIEATSAPQWWRNSATQTRATRIRITNGLVVRHVDAALPPGAAVSGVVRAGDSIGKRLARICVFAQSQTGQFAFAITAKERQLQARRHDHRQLPGPVHAVRQPRQLHLPLTMSVRVRTGQNITRFDAFLQPGAIVSGTVTGTHGMPVGGICVQVQSARAFAGSTTRANGTYSINAPAIRLLHGGVLRRAAGTRAAMHHKWPTRDRRTARLLIPCH